jgi:hypothetical protein
VAAQTTSRVGPRVGLVAPRYVILEDIWDFGGEKNYLDGKLAAEGGSGTTLHNAGFPDGAARGSGIRRIGQLRACAVRGNTHLGGGRWQGGRTSRREDL